MKHWTVWRFHVSKKCWSWAQTSVKGLRDVSLAQGWISDTYLPSNALYGPHCLSHDFTCSAKPALEKQTSQLVLSIQQCTGSVWVRLLAGPIKWNRPSATFWPISSHIWYLCMWAYNPTISCIHIWRIICLHLYIYYGDWLTWSRILEVSTDLVDVKQYLYNIRTYLGT